MFDQKKLIAGAISGIIAAVLVDLDAYKNSEGPYNWSVAVRRIVIGAVTGALGAVGLGGLSS